MKKVIMILCFAAMGLVVNSQTIKKAPTQVKKKWHCKWHCTVLLQRLSRI